MRLCESDNYLDAFSGVLVSRNCMVAEWNHPCCSLSFSTSNACPLATSTINSCPLPSTSCLLYLKLSPSLPQTLTLPTSNPLDLLQNYVDRAQYECREGKWSRIVQQYTRYGGWVGPSCGFFILPLDIQISTSQPTTLNLQLSTSLPTTLDVSPSHLLLSWPLAPWLSHPIVLCYLAYSLHNSHPLTLSLFAVQSMVLWSLRQSRKYY